MKPLAFFRRPLLPGPWPCLVALVLCLGTSAAGAQGAERSRVPHASTHARTQVDDVVQIAPHQWVVLLRTLDGPVRYLPIAVGEQDALAVLIRLETPTQGPKEGRNVLDQVLRDTRVTLTDIKIDDVDHGLFRGRISLRNGRRAWSIRARPGDAIDLALARQVPILVRRSLLDTLGVEGDALLADMPADIPNHASPQGESCAPDGVEALASDYDDSL